MTIIEKLMYEELKEFDQIKEEIIALQEAENLKEPEIYLPFPMDDKFKEEYLATVKHMLKYQKVNLHDTMFVPFKIKEETFDDRLRKLMDVDEEIRKCKIIL
jgi:hypothetical protein